MSGPIEALGQASLLTPPGRGAVAVIAACGPGAERAVEQSFRAANGKPWRRQLAKRIVFGQWVDDRGRSEELIAVRGDAGVLEVHSHGGVAATRRILASMEQSGCEIVDWRQWLASRTSCRLQDEAAVAATAALTLRAAAVLLDQYHGSLRAALEQLLASISSHNRDGAMRQLQTMLDRAPLGLHLTRPWRVAIAGRPNVGKSSLINALAGYDRSIVFDQPGTTRDVLTVETAIDGWPVQLTDAAGARRTDDALEAAGVEQAVQQIEAADLVVWVLDAAALTQQQRQRPTSLADRQMREVLGSPLLIDRRLIVLNKIDLLPTAHSVAVDQATPISALRRYGVEQLLTSIADRLVPPPVSPGDAVPFAQHQVELLQQAVTALQGRQFDLAFASIRRIFDA